MRIALRADEGERAEPASLDSHAPGRVEHRQRLRDPGARRRGGSGDGPVERAVDRPELLELIRIEVPCTRHDDLTGRGGGSKPLKDRRQAGAERRNRARPELADAANVALALIEQQ